MRVPTQTRLIALAAMLGQAGVCAAAVGSPGLEFVGHTNQHPGVHHSNQQAVSAPFVEGVEGTVLDRMRALVAAGHAPHAPLPEQPRGLPELPRWMIHGNSPPVDPWGSVPGLNGPPVPAPPVVGALVLGVIAAGRRRRSRSALR